MKKKNTLILLTLFCFVFAGCKKKEISLLQDLTEKIKESKGDVEKAKTALKKFLKEESDSIDTAVRDFKESEKKERYDRYLDFNRHFYNKGSLFEIANDYEYFKDKEFDALFEKIKKKLGIFFQSEKSFIE